MRDEDYPPIWTVKRRYPIGSQVKVTESSYNEYFGRTGKLISIDDDDQATPYAVQFPEEDQAHQWIENVEPVGPPPPTFSSQQEADEWLKKSNTPSSATSTK